MDLSGQSSNESVSVYFESISSDERDTALCRYSECLRHYSLVATRFPPGVFGGVDRTRFLVLDEEAANTYPSVLGSSLCIRPSTEHTAGAACSTGSSKSPSQKVIATCSVLSRWDLRCF